MTERSAAVASPCYGRRCRPVRECKFELMRERVSVYMRAKKTKSAYEWMFVLQQEQLESGVNASSARARTTNKQKKLAEEQRKRRGRYDEGRETNCDENESREMCEEVEERDDNDHDMRWAEEVMAADHLDDCLSVAEHIPL